MLVYVEMKNIEGQLKKITEMQECLTKLRNIMIDLQRECTLEMSAVPDAETPSTAAGNVTADQDGRRIPPHEHR